MHPRSFVRALPAVLALSSTGAALAQPVVGVFDEGTSCPTAAAVAAELTKLIPGHRSLIGVRSRLEVRVFDRGESYRVRAAGVERDLADTERRCAERARSAAVVAALAIAPPSLDIGTRATPRPSRDRQARVVIEVGPYFDAADFSGRGIQAMPGAALRFAAGVPWLQGVFGIAFLASSDVDLGVGVGARVSRVPLDLGFRLTLRRSAFELSGELGLSMTALGIEGRTLMQPAKDTQLDLGLRVAALFRHWSSARFGWFVGPVLVVGARAYELSADRLGVVGTTPRLRVGAIAGVSIRLH